MRARMRAILLGGKCSILQLGLREREIARKFTPIPVCGGLNVETEDKTGGRLMREIAILLLIAIFFGFVLIGEMPGYMATVLTLFLLFSVMLASLPSHIAEMESGSEQLNRKREKEDEGEANTEMEQRRRLSWLDAQNRRESPHEH